MRRGFTRIAARLCSLSLSWLLAACATSQPIPDALNGMPVVGIVTRVEPATIWTGDVPGEGHIFWMKLEGPKQSVISFSSTFGCPAAKPSSDRYVVFLSARKLGYSSELKQRDLPALTVSSCAKADPESSVFQDFHG